MRQTLLPVISLLGLLSSPALGQEPSAGTGAGPTFLPNTGSELLDLIEHCDDDRCMSYVSGVIGGISIYAMLAEKPSPFCAGGAVKTERIREVIVEALTSSEELRKNHPAVGVLAAFGQTWPCLTNEDFANLEASDSQWLAPELVASLTESGRHAVEFGDAAAPADRRIALFHDPSLEASLDMRAEMEKLVDEGWRVRVFPVSFTSDDAIGYGAVQTALRKDFTAAAMSLYEATPTSADFDSALAIAQDAGIATGDILRALATSGAYSDVETTTRILAEAGVERAPSWIVGNEIYSGFLGAEAIRNIAAGGNTANQVPSPSEPPQDPAESTEVPE